MPSEASLANLRPWQPGQSGYAGHQPKGLRRVLSMCRKNTPEAVEVILACMRDTEATWRERITAATWVVERAWGKSESRLHLDGADGMNVMIVTGVPEADSILQQQPVADETFTIEYDADAGEEEA